MAKEILYSVVCPTCEAKIGVHDKRLINQLVQCPKCGSIVLLSAPKGNNLPLKTEDEQQTVAPPTADLISQPVSVKKDENGNKPTKRSASSASGTLAVPVPPSAAIPVPPPVLTHKPAASESIMPEPMLPGAVKPKSSPGDRHFTRLTGSLSKKYPLWMPYLIIGTGVIALIYIFSIFLLGNAGKNINDYQTVVEDSETGQGEEEMIFRPVQKSEGVWFNASVVNEDHAQDEEDEINIASITNLSIERNRNPGIDLIQNDEDFKPVEDDPANNDDKNTNIKSELNAENKPVENDSSVKPQPEEEPEDTDADQPADPVEPEDDNPFRDLEVDPFHEVKAADPVQPEVADPVQKDEEDANDDFELDLNVRSVDNPVETGAAATSKNLTSSSSNVEKNPAADSESNSETMSIPGLSIHLKSISIHEQKLSQCLQTIRELGALPVEVDWDSLRRNGINADDKISWTGKDVTLQTALSEVLAQRKLMFKINSDGKIVFAPRASVNARSDLNSNLSQGGSEIVKTQYSVSDLVGQSPEKTASLIKSIREFLCPGDWKEVGGTGTISASGGGSVTVTQSQQNQWIIADFLDRLRLARRMAPLYNSDTSLELMSVRAQSALKRNVGINFQPSAGLKTALSEIGLRIGVNILLDEPSLKIAGISAQFPISFDAREMSLEETFNRINEETGLVYLAQTPNSFIVTIPDSLKSLMSVEFFSISDLVNIGLTPTVLMEQIIKFEPKSWKSQDAASFGLIEFDENSDYLIVRQSPTVLSKISELLTQLRARLNEKE